MDVRKTVAQLLGWILYWVVRCLYGRHLTSILQDVFGQHHNGRHKWLLMFAGKSLSGKTTVKNKLREYVPALKGAYEFNTREMHDVLNRDFQLLAWESRHEHGKVQHRPLYWLRQALTQHMREEAIAWAVRTGRALVIDCCNLTEKERSARLSAARAAGYRCFVIFVRCEEHDLLNRARAMDRENVLNGKASAWESLVEAQSSVLVFGPQDARPTWTIDTGFASMDVASQVRPIAHELNEVLAGAAVHK